MSVSVTAWPDTGINIQIDRATLIALLLETEKIWGKVHITVHFIQVSPSESTVVRFSLTRMKNKTLCRLLYISTGKDVYGQCLLSFSAPDKILRKGRLLKPVWLGCWNQSGWGLIYKDREFKQVQRSNSNTWAHPGNKQITYDGRAVVVVVVVPSAKQKHRYPNREIHLYSQTQLSFYIKGCLTSQGLSVSETETHIHALEPGRFGSTSRQLITSTTDPDRALPFFHYPQMIDKEKKFKQNV